MTKSTVYTSDKGQTVYLPESVALPESVKHVDIVKLGKARLITPMDASWDSFFDGPSVADNVMCERAQPTIGKSAG